MAVDGTSDGGSQRGGASGSPAAGAGRISPGAAAGPQAARSTAGLRRLICEQGLSAKDVRLA